MSDACIREQQQLANLRLLIRIIAAKWMFVEDIKTSDLWQDKLY